MDDEKNSEPGYGIESAKFRTDNSPYDKLHHDKPAATNQRSEEIRREAEQRSERLRIQMMRQAALQKEEQTARVRAEEEQRKQERKEAAEAYLRRRHSSPTPSQAGSSGTGCIMQILFALASITLLIFLLQLF